MDVNKHERLNKDLDQIKLLIKSKVKQGNLISIILYGSYGREEGAFYQIGNGTLEPYNDYDIVLIINTPLSTSLLKSIEDDLKNSLSVRWIDISQKTISQLESLKASVFNFDLKNGSKIIYGDSTILNRIPKFKPEELPLIEAEVLFFTRLWCFCGCLKENWRSEGVSEDELRFFRNQMAKAILAIGDVLLLSTGEYESSYVKRVRKLSDQYINEPDFVKLLTWALDEKLTPKSESMEVTEIEKLYHNVAELYYYKTLKVMSQKYAKQLLSIDQYYKVARGAVDNRLLALKILLKKGRFQTTGFKSIDWAQAYILESYLFGKEKSSLRKVQKILDKNRAHNEERSFRSWDEMRIKVAEIKLGGEW